MTRRQRSRVRGLRSREGVPMTRAANDVLVYYTADSQGVDLRVPRAEETGGTADHRAERFIRQRTSPSRPVLQSRLRPVRGPGPAEPGSGKRAPSTLMCSFLSRT